MAISKNIVSLNPGFARTDLIYQLEEQFADLNLHGSGRSGLLSGISSYTDPGQVSNMSVFNNGSNPTIFEDVKPISTTGIGTGASFNITRATNGYVESVRLNRPGYGYTGGDKITISAESTGGSVSGANDIVIQPTVYALKTANAQTYNITLSGFYEVSGTDRNGGIGSDKIITIKEGDTINFTNNLGSNTYGLNICWDRGYSSSYWNATDNSNRYYAGTTNKVFNADNTGGYGGGTGDIFTWKPEFGQRGLYRILDDSGYSSIGQTDPITIIVEPDDSNWSYPTVGSATTFYSSDTTPGSNYPWGILKREIEPDKKYGTTYRGFEVISDNDISIHVGNDFFPNIIRIYDRYSGTSPHTVNRFCGALDVDIPYTLGISSVSFNSSTGPSGGSNPTYRQVNINTHDSNAYQLDLTSYKSALDSRFVVYSYRQPTLSSTALSGNTFGTFILHDHIGTIWDHDQLFTSSVTEIRFEGGNTIYPSITFRTYIAGEIERDRDHLAIRAGEYGYVNDENDDNNVDFSSYVDTKYKPNSYKSGTDVVASEARIYYRGLQDRNDLPGITSEITSDMDFNAVIKGIPINAQLIPYPFYIPDDFVLIQFDYAGPNANIQQGDTVTISPSEVYEVIVGSYNQTDRTRGILFCARTT